MLYLPRRDFAATAPALRGVARALPDRLLAAEPPLALRLTAEDPGGEESLVFGAGALTFNPDGTLTPDSVHVIVLKKRRYRSGCPSRRGEAAAVLGPAALWMRRWVALATCTSPICSKRADE